MRGKYNRKQWYSDWEQIKKRPLRIFLSKYILFRLQWWGWNRSRKMLITLLWAETYCLGWILTHCSDNVELVYQAWLICKWVACCKWTETGLTCSVLFQWENPYLKSLNQWECDLEQAYGMGNWLNVVCTTGGERRGDSIMAILEHNCFQWKYNTLQTHFEGIRLVNTWIPIYDIGWSWEWIVECSHIHQDI